MKPKPNPEEQAFQKAIRAKPEARAIRLVYADWLDERDDPRGELIRIEEEMRTAAIYSDVYWQLKPRRRELLALVEKPWLKQMGYGGTDYQPVFADIPDGWKERWRLLREFVERWYQIPMDDVGGPLKPFPPESREAEDLYATTVDVALNDPSVRDTVPPSVREWASFVRDLQLGLDDFGSGSGDTHYFFELEGQLHFAQHDGTNDLNYVRPEDRDEPDPAVWLSNRTWLWEREMGGTRLTPIPATTEQRQATLSRLIASSVTTRAFSYFFIEPVLSSDWEIHEQALTTEFAGRLEKYFPVRSRFGDVQVFERPDVIALWTPPSAMGGDTPSFRFLGRTRKAWFEASDQLFGNDE